MEKGDIRSKEEGAVVPAVLNPSEGFWAKAELDPWALCLTLLARGRRTLAYRTSAPRVAGSMTVYQLCSYAIRRGLTPDGEDGLEDKVERNPVKDSSDTHRFDKVKTAKDDLFISLRDRATAVTEQQPADLPSR